MKRLKEERKLSMVDIANLGIEEGRKLLFIPFTVLKDVPNFIDAMTNIMKESRGRDQICSFIQYSSDFYYQCHKNSNLPHIKALTMEKLLINVEIARRVKDSMKKGRKIFKFLKFMEQYQKIAKTWSKDHHVAFKIILILRRLCTTFYYIIDNILWAISIASLNDLVLDSTISKIKAVKDIFSLIKTILKITISNFNLYVYEIKEKQCMRDVFILENVHIREGDQRNIICNELLKIRCKRKFEYWGILCTVLRVIMLSKRLKIAPMYFYINEIFYAICGLICNYTVLYSIFEKEQIKKSEKKKKETTLKQPSSMNYLENMDQSQDGDDSFVDLKMKRVQNPFTMKKVSSVGSPDRVRKQNSIAAELFLISENLEKHLNNIDSEENLGGSGVQKPKHRKISSNNNIDLDI